MAAEQENTIAALHEKIKQKEEEVIRLRAQIATSEKHIKSEKHKYVSVYVYTVSYMICRGVVSFAHFMFTFVRTSVIILCEITQAFVMAYCVRDDCKKTFVVLQTWII